MAASTYSEFRYNENVAFFAVLSRLIVIILQVVFNLLISDHDAGVFNPPTPSDDVPSATDRLAELLLGGFRRWDSIYMLHVAEFGYTYENSLAFFPLYPLLVRSVVNSILFPLQFLMSYHSIVLLSGVLINFLLFIKTAENLFKLGQKITKNDRIAYIGALLFCINPATVFMTAPYSEILFIYLSVKGMLDLENDNKLFASIFFGLSCVTRSNGLLNIGYLAYRIVKLTIIQFRIFKQGMFMNFTTFYTTLWILFSVYIGPYIFLILISLLPFIMYQYFCYALYCENSLKIDIPGHIRDYVKVRPYLKLYGEPKSPWCHNSVPLAYSYIQKHYWEQGLFNYWEWKHVPHFLLAMPVALLSLGAAVSYYKHNRYICWTLGLDDAGARKKQSSHDTSHDQPLYQLEGKKMLPYVLHAVVLTVFGWFCIHVQVLTRLLFSSTPVLYWYSALLLFPDTKKQEQTNKYDVRATSRMKVEDEKHNHKWSNILTDKIYDFRRLKMKEKLLLVYFLGYFVIGIALFSNFLPWT